MRNKKEYQDDELGKIVVIPNGRATHIIMRAKPDAVYVTIPCGVKEKEVKEVIDKYRVQLLADVKKAGRKHIDLDFRIDTEFFHLKLVGGEREKFLAHSELGNMKIICPPGADFDDENLQTWLYKVIEEALRRNAKIILPPRLYMLSEKYGLPYHSLKINSSKGRWGSCSAKKNINLSYYLVLLPSHLIDYVLLHELAHTKEMNHGEPFWSLLNELTGGKAQELRNELKKYKTEI